MQIRLTVVDPLGPPPQRGRAVSRDVLVTAPVGTELGAVASALAGAVAGEGGAGREAGASVVLYAGAERLDPRRSTLGEPPLVDGAVLSLGAPAQPEPHPELDSAPAQLHVVAGPDAGGVHLLHGGRITVGRSADADVPLDDPDVSRLHCAVTVGADGRVSVADLGSTNGTSLDGTRVTDRPVRVPAGGLLRIGESALRVTPSGGAGIRVRAVPDGEGRVRVGVGGDGPGPEVGPGPTSASGIGSDSGSVPGQDAVPGPGSRSVPGAAPRPSGQTHHAYGSYTPAAQTRDHRIGQSPVVPGQAGAPSVESRSAGFGVPGAVPGGAATHAGRFGIAGGPGGTPGAAYAGAPGGEDPRPSGRKSTPVRGTDLPPGGLPGPDGTTYTQYGDHPGHPDAPYGDHPGPADAPYGNRPGRIDVPQGAHPLAGDSGVHGAPARPAAVPQGARRRGFGAWARRLTGGRGEQAGGAVPYDAVPGPAADGGPAAAGAVPRPDTWPDPAALLLTALGPGPRLWERGPGHPEALTVRLGTADRSAPDGSGLLPAVPVTAALREAGALGLAGPRPRLSGLARAVLAQLAALHSPDLLEIVLISADRSRPVADRTEEWAWLGWLPHVRPGHGQDCRLLLAYDREQAAARVEELLRRAEDHTGTPGEPYGTVTGAGPAGAMPAATGAVTGPTGTIAGPAGVPAQHALTGPAGISVPAQGTPARTSGLPASGFPAQSSGHPASNPLGTPGSGSRGPFTVVVVDGDPGGSALRDALARLAVAGPRAGIHLVCLAETEPASPVSPVARTYEAACAVTPAFRHCGAVALLSGDVATALQLLRMGPGGPVGPGTHGTVDAVSAAWADRFARALAPLRPDGPDSEPHPRVAAPLPRSARLLDELGLARATPASLMARWADAADDTESPGGRARAVLGAGPRGPVTVDLVAEGPHLLVEGPAGSGRTELLRTVVASLAAAERPDRLAVALLDGRDGAGTGAGRGEGLRVCTDIPHVTTHLIANDPVRMREFAQSLSAELKRRAELLGRTDFARWHAGREVSGRMVAQRGPAVGSASGDIEAPPSSTLRLRPGAAARQRAAAAPPLPRLVVVVDDLDALVSPALGSPGRPAAGSVIRALEAVARDGDRLGVHLVAAAGADGRTAQSEPARRAALRVVLDAPQPGPEQPAPGRGRLAYADGPAVGFQGGRVTGRIPRTATQRPTVVPLDWARAGDPPARRPVRELGNGPTDLALLASAVERAAREVAAAEIPSLL
ncbi:FHA domain-containing protein [Streptomyces sp. CSDS2]|uniref:FtsK/SpoIIIE domain-containing protein n=1 Tax=Streptomyces sp. CSDS2 TaxID=3055051 RepID=UPI0025B1E8EE|nr:FtsK/SpoIIIE domain-containing protein [Streptomyces sp. CSDS2]MDN3262488.1 FHA domain-containing protein [Streptomyces sp. CSDS2]